MDILLFILLNITPILIHIFGRIFIKRPPKSINFSYGYRTKRSMATKAAWAYAHEVCGQMWYKGSIVLSIFVSLSYIVLMLFFKQYQYDLLLTLFLIPVVFMLYSIYYTEGKLKKKFSSGNT